MPGRLPVFAGEHSLDALSAAACNCTLPVAKGWKMVATDEEVELPPKFRLPRDGV
jgi:hypothetical protein